eukprot:1161219-Pelagomonas_calceolata.AAC.4
MIRVLTGHHPKEQQHTAEAPPTKNQTRVIAISGEVQLTSQWPFITKPCAFSQFQPKMLGPLSTS